MNITSPVRVAQFMPVYGRGDNADSLPSHDGGVYASVRSTACTSFTRRNGSRPLMTAPESCCSHGTEPRSQEARVIVAEGRNHNDRDPTAQAVQTGEHVEAPVAWHSDV